VGETDLLVAEFHPKCTNHVLFQTRIIGNAIVMCVYESHYCKSRAFVQCNIGQSKSKHLTYCKVSMINITFMRGNHASNYTSQTCRIQLGLFEEMSCLISRHWALFSTDSVDRNSCCSGIFVNASNTILEQLSLRICAPMELLNVVPQTGSL
jgi:hypothetical protein